MHLTTEQVAVKKELGIIMELAYEKTQTTASDVFVRYMGHTDHLEVQIYKNGWQHNTAANTYTKPSDKWEIFLGGQLAPENVPAELAKIIRKLQEL